MRIFKVILYQLQCDAEHQFEAWFKDIKRMKNKRKKTPYMSNLWINQGKQGAYVSEN